MAQPVPYHPSADFSDEEVGGVAGRSSVRTSALDAELAAIEATLEDILENLAIIQRDDTELADGIVEIHTLSDGVRDLMASAAFTIRGGWVTATAYALGDIVEQSGAVYLCVVAHTSGTFATDLAASKWGPITSAGTTAAGTTFSPTSTIAAINAQAAITELDTDLRPYVNVLSHRNFGGI